MKKIFMSFIAVLLSLVTVDGAFSTWWFVIQQSVDGEIKSVAVDNIEENYSFTGKAKVDTIKEYTIYLFPSSIYLEDIHTNNIEKPEETYGYVEAKLDSRDNVTYEVHDGTNLDGAATGDEAYLYRVANLDDLKSSEEVNEGEITTITSPEGDPTASGQTQTETQTQIVTYKTHNYTVTLINGQTSIEDKLTIREVTQTRTRTRTSTGWFSYRWGNWSQYSNWSSSSETNNATVEYITNPNAGGTLDQGYISAGASALSENNLYYDPYQTGYDTANNRGYGTPEEAASGTFSSYYNSNNGLDTEEGMRHNYRNLHRYDRFGYWPTLAKDEGRYLPLKISINENFSLHDLNKVIMTPLADMGDNRDWYCYTFTMWAYANYKNQTDGKPTYPYFITNTDSTYNAQFPSDKLKAFAPTKVVQYFDTTRALEQYADENGIIRLYPKFSQGKGYNVHSVDDGGGDSVRINAQYADGKTGDRMKYLSYIQSDSGLLLQSYTFDGNDGKSTSVSNVSVLMFSNLNIDNYNSFTLEVAPTHSIAGWNFGWVNAYTFDSTILQKLRDTYGNGLYNLYVFLGYTATSGGSANQYLGPSTNKNKIVDDANAGNIFSNLKGARFINLTDSISSDLDGKSLSYSGGYKPICIALVKRRELHIINDINYSGTATEDENTTNAIMDQTEEELRAGYDAVDVEFRTIGLPMYYQDASSTENIDIANSSTVQSIHPYCYLMKNIDFTNIRTPCFQIRSQRGYMNLVFQSDEKNKIIFNPASDGKYEKEQVYINYSSYFELKCANVDGSPQYFFELNGNSVAEKRRKCGVYDFILIAEYHRNSDDTTTVNVYFYVYRHTNIFIKVMANKPSEKEGIKIENDKETGTGQMFSDCSGSFKNNLLIFQREYALGEAMARKDLNEEIGEGSNEFNDFFKSKIGQELDSCVKEFVEKYVNGKNVDLSKVILRDSITGAMIGYFKALKGTDSPDGNDIEYVGSDNSKKYYRLTFEEFYIRKNYVIYFDFSQALS